MNWPVRLSARPLRVYHQVAAIEQWLRSEMRYVSGASNPKTSAVETADSRIGVCRDYAHLGISLTRSLNIPARMVVGYLYRVEPIDLHAWFEPLSEGAGSLLMALSKVLAVIALLLVMGATQRMSR